MSLQILAGEKFLVTLVASKLFILGSFARPGPGVHLQVVQQLLLIIIVLDQQKIT